MVSYELCNSFFITDTITDVPHSRPPTSAHLNLGLIPPPLAFTTLFVSMGYGYMLFG